MSVSKNSTNEEAPVFPRFGQTMCHTKVQQPSTTITYQYARALVVVGVVAGPAMHPRRRHHGSLLALLPTGTHSSRAGFAVCAVRPTR
jgi:hypothetical protein